MRFLRRSLVGLFLLAATLGLLALAGNSLYSAVQLRNADDRGARPARERVLAVNVVPFLPETVVPVLSTFGEIRSRRTLEIRASAAGEVIELGNGVQDGGRVTAGQLLFRVDPTNAMTALEVAQTDVLDAEAELRDARRSVELAGEEVASARAQARLRQNALQRQRDLAERGVGTAAAVEAAELSAAAADQAVLSRRQSEAQAQARLDQAATQLSRREIALDEARRRVADTEVRAEFSGVLGDVSVVKGRLVTSNEKLALLIDPERLEISFRVSTPQYARLLDDQGRLIGSDLTVSLLVNGFTLTTTGKITREGAAVGVGQTGRLLYADLASATGFRPGDFATVDINEPALERVARLPAAAVDSAGTILLLGQDERLEVASVMVERRQGDDVLVRAQGLQGRDVVAERSPLLGAGIKVRPLRPETVTENAAPAPPAMVELTEERRARLIAFVEGNGRMPAEAKERVLAQLREPSVPAQTIERIEQRMGG
ncbi:efflux RND transporter periplasmic adaptor subunit [Oceaniglobus ichthyenteri]|uniref:efflux RND transporter periplasmic adaptor subunit n=1 Tax=Oceaniglobus ichthyenteri TaxID=2136177 RepID=UPI000D36A510|nr:HlyD family efflux transporter periplasmic adaptor subunit [Oceaniglobus ichthyenteri]